MKKHYDFSKAQQGTLYRPAKSLRVPVYLDEDVQRKLAGGKKRPTRNLSKLVNDVLRHELGLA